MVMNLKYARGARDLLSGVRSGNATGSRSSIAPKSANQILINVILAIRPHDENR